MMFSAALRLASLLWLMAAACYAFSVGQNADVAGTWDMTVDAPSGSGEAVLVLKQDGQQISGTYRGRMGESSLSGTIRANNIRFTVALRFQDMSFTVVYTGSVEADRMKGTVDFGEAGRGTWTARRRPKA